MFKRGTTYELGAPTRKKHSAVKRLFILLVVLIVLIAGGMIVVRRVYDHDLQAVSSDQTAQVITVKTGSSSSVIANQLEKDKLIRSAWAFELYVHSKELGNQLQAGTYSFSPSQGTISIVNTLTKGNVTTNLVTILPGRRLDQVRSDLINAGFSPTSVDAALEPAQYADLPALAYKPSNASLEGLLYPDSFQRTAATDPQVIVRESLQEMGEHLTPDLQAAYTAQGLTTYQGLVLASIVEKEVSRVSDKPQVAQVFLKRFDSGSTLGSDVTAFYGAIVAGKTPSVTYESVYNTRLHPGLPPTPIATVSDTSLQAVAHPASTSWLYFVSGDDGNTYFSNTLAEHDAQTAQYCHKLCSE